jgi:colanic acid biosynthesis glycosyl transferase WcaI
MRILVFEYSGHPFSVHLSRELARRGHEVVHSWSGGFQSPKGNLAVQPDDPPGFSTRPVRNRAAFAKGSFFTRRRQEVEIGEELAKLCAEVRPDVIIGGNAPIDAQRLFQKAARRLGIPFVFWLQDIYSRAISAVVPRKFPVIGHAIAAWYRHLEFAMLRSSDHVVAITRDFVPILTRRGVDPSRITVIENWAPLADLAPCARDNPWASAHMGGEGLRIVYSGTLGYKHNPRLLLDMARALPDAHVHVFSEGEVAARLGEDARAQGLTNLAVHPWVAIEHLSQMLSGADIFITVIEPEAGIYSVPSKVLSYLAIGRPILASIPPENLAARLITGNEAGFVAAPGREGELIERARMLAAEPLVRQRLGINGRAYATRAFDIAAIAKQFEAIITARTETGTKQ